MQLNLCKTLLLLVIAAGPLRAQLEALPVDSPETSASASETATIPVRTARLAFFSGDLQVQRADNTGADDAVLNMPLSEGTRLITGDYSQAEIEFEDGSVARLTPRSSLSLDSLALEGSTAHTVLTLLSGLAYFELRAAPVSTWQVNAGGVSASPDANAVLRVSLEQAPTFSCISGAATVASPEGFSASVKAGESLRPDADDDSRYFLNQQVADNSWDTWNQSRDELAVSDAASRTSARASFAGTQGYGWSDLDANGTWYTAPASSAAAADGDVSGDEVWQPTVADADDSFDPYADGAFVWSGQGYVYASAYAWGWLPYRCGRWNFYPGFGWAWRPSRFCGLWGFGGVAGTGIHIGRRPPHYEPIKLPLRGPGPVHPIHRIGRPNPPQPESPCSSYKVARINGVIATPLKPTPTPSAANGFVAGQTLYRDFPVEATSHRPIFGAAAKPVVPSSDPEMPVSGWISREAPPRPPASGIVRTSSNPAQPRPVLAVPPVQQHIAPPAPPAPRPAAPPAAAPSSTSKPK